MGVGKVLAQQSDFERAIDQFEQVLLVNPRDAEAHFAIGFTRQMQGRTDLAIERYRRALQLNPNHKNARMRLNDALSRDD
jgi:Flp pilus assembly protein TadD